ncbi:hypothetical protein [Brevibacillus parabrevis]|uniref:Uncharacterized protein n=1 Tax=Brevibacillus parabrevis TaxID=54914 RepID=A0A4Y3PSE9_BREPA|nr:hypothetical protein [Brevibacillus parabrevis]RNB95013.1 hypothetical protein EDM60_14180 [Brevibacillus parabrevis]GEB35885.1 hypothetical protein BPA01_54650 [Brevibacillus parabrevis]
MRDDGKDLAVCKAATDGPWYANTSWLGWLASEVTTNPGASAYEWVCQLWYRDEEVMRNHTANARFIAEARESLLHWIERAQAAEAEVDRLRKEHHFDRIELN